MANSIVKSTGAMQMWQDPEQKANIMALAADVFQIAPEDKDRQDVQAAIMSAMNRCVQYGLLPASDVWMIPFSKSVKTARGWEKQTTYAVDTGVASWEKFADKQARDDWMPEYRERPAGEVTRLLGADYIDGCIGFQCRIWRLSKAVVMKQIGLEPEWYPGFYLVEMKDEYKNGSRTGKKIAKPENIPSYRTAEDVAKRRALKHALSRNFTPCYVGDLGQEPEKQIVYALEDAKATIVERHRSPDARETDLPVGGDRFVEGDDGMLWASDGDEKVQFVDGDGVITESSDDQDPDQGGEDVIDGEFTVSGGGDQESGIMSAKAEAWMLQCRKYHLTGDGPAGKTQYGFLVGALDAITGSKDGHTIVLNAMCDGEMSSANPPSGLLAGKLLDYLVEETGKKGEKVKNPLYQPVFVGYVKEIYAANRGGG